MTVEVQDAVLIPIIIGIVQLLKVTGIQKRLLPISSLILGILAGIFYVNPQDIRSGILVGVMMGLSASGMYSGGKAIMERDEFHDDW